MYIETNVPVNDGYVSDGGQSWVETPSFNSIYIKGDSSERDIKGVVDVGSDEGF